MNRYSTKKTDKRGNKDWRRGYHGSASFDASCRPGGDCPWCQGNRTYRERRESQPDEVRKPRFSPFNGGCDAPWLYGITGRY